MRWMISTVLIAAGCAACTPAPKAQAPARPGAGPATAPRTEQRTQPPVLTRVDQLDAHLDRLVTLRGEVSNTKIPTVLGVDVSSDDPDLRGQDAEATGVLIRWTVTREELEAAIAEHGMFAHRGPGVFYRLKSADSDADAPVRPVGSEQTREGEGR